MRHPWFFAIGILGAFIAEGGQVAAPLFMRNLFNLLSGTSGAIPTLSVLIIPLGFYALASLISWLGGRLEMWFGYNLIAKVETDLTTYAFDNLMRHSYQFFSSSFGGALTRRIGRFSDSFENLYYSIVTSLLETALYVLGVTAVLLYRNWTLGTVVLVWIVFFIILQWWFTRWQQPLRLKRAEENTNLTATLADSISNQNTVALFSANVYEEERIEAAANKLQDAQVRSWDTNVIIYGAQGLLSIALSVSMFWLGIILWRQGVLGIGDLVLIQLYVFGIFNNVWSIGRQFQVIYTSIADASEMVEIIQTPHEVADKPGASALRVEKGGIIFRNMNFYFNETRPIFKNLNLHIAPREKVALVGPSGAGKSTLTKLLLRLYDVSEGEIEIDGQNIADVTQNSLRDSIAFVPQEPILFHRTLMENIRYGRRDAMNEEVLSAARKAHCHEFISGLPQQYDTYVGERGIKLSGGERQRVAIARAILKNAPILLLDEATSSLDSESEALIQDALEVLMRDKTVLVIAHRLSTIMKMDRIVVLQNGAVVAQGTHAELLAQGGLYQKLWSIQAGGFIGGGNDEEQTISQSEEGVEIEERELAPGPKEE